MKRVLIIEDENDLVDSLEKTLRSNGYHVSSALNGQDGLQKAQRERPNLILLDIMLPGLDGFQVLKRLKNDSGTDLIPVIMLTAKGETSSILEAEKLEAADYIIKPFELDELLNLIKKYL